MFLYNVSGSWYTYFYQPRRKATMLLSEDTHEPNDYDNDGYALASAGFGTDEDYGYYPEDDWGTVESELFGDC